MGGFLSVIVVLNLGWFLGLFWVFLVVFRGFLGVCFVMNDKKRGCFWVIFGNKIVYFTLFLAKIVVCLRVEFSILMVMSLKDKSDRLILEYIISTYPRIKVNPGSCRFNLRCADNSVHEAIQNSDDCIAMCFYIDRGQPIIHFINCSKGEFIDNTLGNWASQYEYYMVKNISSEDFYNVHEIFLAFRNKVRKMIPFYIRWFIDSDY